jgi:hypothetical protein
MNWIKCDSIEYSWLDTLTLYRSAENQYLSMIARVDISEVSVIAKGTYIYFGFEFVSTLKDWVVQKRAKGFS